MGTVYIVTLHQVEARKIYENLKELKADSALEYEFLRPLQMPEAIQEGCNLVVYSNPHVLNLEMKQQISQWRKRGLLAPLLFISRVANEKHIDEMTSLKHFVLLEKPYVDRDLLGIAQKLMESVQVPQRKFRRFNANQMVEATSYKTEIKNQCRVNNISMGGVCLEDYQTPLEIGELLHLNFHLDRLNTERMMCGRVVWTQTGAKNSAGVEFVKEHDLYGQLLKTIA